MTRWIIRHDDDQCGRTYVSAWHVDLYGDVDCSWTRSQREALRFQHPDIAKLVATRGGGEVKKLVSEAFREVKMVRDAYDAGRAAERVAIASWLETTKRAQAIRGGRNGMAGWFGATGALIRNGAHVTLPPTGGPSDG